MAPITCSYDVKSSIPPAKLFKAFILDHSLLPKVLPQVIKKAEILQGDGGAGSIKLMAFSEGKSDKHRIDTIDKEKMTCSFTVIEGDSLKDKLEKISYEIKIEASGDGGSIYKTTCTYHTKGNAQITEEEIKIGKEGALGMFKAVEAYLQANPNAYN